MDQEGVRGNLGWGLSTDYFCRKCHGGREGGREGERERERERGLYVD